MNGWGGYHRKQYTRYGNKRLIQIKSYLPRIKKDIDLNSDFSNLKYLIKKGGNK